MTFEPLTGDEAQADPAAPSPAPPRSPLPRPEVQGLTPYAPGKAKVAGVNRVWKLSSNENPFGVPPGAQRAIAEAAAESHRYPDGASVELRRALGARFGLDPDRIVCGAGSDELILHLCDAYGGPGRELVMNRHSFSMYDIAGRKSGCAVVKVPERGLTADVDAMLAAVTPRTSLVFLANPDNPTGSFVPEDEVARLRAGLPPHVLLVLDSAYAEYVDRPDYDPGVKLVDAGDNTVMLRTFSKAYGLGGMRVGWAYAPPAVVDVLNRMRAPFNLSVVAQAAGIAALAEPGWVDRTRDHNTAQRAKLAATLRAAGFEVWPSEANFLLVDFGSPARGEAANRFLDARGLIVRAMGAYELPHMLRVTIGTEEECAMLAEALAAFRTSDG